MTTSITQTKIEVAIADTTDFLNTERGVGLDGDYASGQLASRIEPVQQQAEAFLKAVPLPSKPGWHVPLSRSNADLYDDAVALLPGYLVLVHASAVQEKAAEFFPAVISEDSIATQSLRLHVYKHPYRRQLRYEAAVALSAAGQSETAGMGGHGKLSSDGVEAEHFAALLTAGGDQRIQSAWQSGNHVNHTLRNTPNNSVTTTMSNKLFGEDIPQTTITMTRQQIAGGKAVLFWHQGLLDPESGQPETAARDGALVTIQSLGFQALRDRDLRSGNSKHVDALKAMIA